MTTKYEKTVWVDQDVENPRTYVETINDDGTMTLTDAFGAITTSGTPITAARLNNLEDGVEATAAWSMEGALTNCILSSGVYLQFGIQSSLITLYAGSKVVMPDGSYTELTADIAWDASTTDGTFIIAYQSGIAMALDTSLQSSGDGVPTDETSTAGYYYDYTNKQFYYYIADSWETCTMSLPFAQVKVENGTIAEIVKLDVISYFGKTAWGLPVTGLFASGINTDGTYKATRYENNLTQRDTWTSDSDGANVIVLRMTDGSYDSINPSRAASLEFDTAMGINTYPTLSDIAGYADSIITGTAEYLANDKILSITSIHPVCLNSTNIQVDDALDSTSANPVQNKVVTAAIENIGSGIVSVTEAEYNAMKADGTLDAETFYAITDDTTETSGGSSLVPGTIIQSTIPQTDAGLHLADGTLLSGTGTYSTFYNYFADNAELFAAQLTTEDEWQASVTAHGVCGKYVLDTDALALRLPLITGFVEGVTSDAGGLNEAGLPNIEGSLGRFPYNVGVDAGYTSSSGALSYTQDSGVSESVNTNSSTTSAQTGYIRFDASLSNSIYGNSEIVQPQSIKVYYYIVVGNVDDSSVTVDALAGKADTDLSNVSDAGKVESISWGIPDYDNAVSREYNTTYTTTKNCFVTFEVRSANNTSVYITIDDNIFSTYTEESTSGSRGGGQFFISKGSSWVVSGGYLGSTYNTIYEIPLKGEV